MHIDHLQIELRPRTNAQALDLGFALLRSHASAAYCAFLALWLPLLGVVMLLTAWKPDLTALWMLGGWWLKPALERAPLYVLSRQVFGTAVTWQEAVRAWPRQLGGGLWRLLTWGRPFSAGCGLYQPVWQLEMARGKVASARMRVLSRNSTGHSAFWFGVVCGLMEIVLFLGMAGFIGIFISEASFSNPFSLFVGAARREDAVIELVIVALAGIARAVVAPVYTACCFCLYLNRRASLEAWDIELQLRQIRPLPGRKARSHAAALAFVGALLLAIAPAPDSMAAPAQPSTPQCTPPDSAVLTRTPAQDPAQAALRRQLDQVYASADLRGYECVARWRWKHAKEEQEKNKPKQRKPTDLSLLAEIIKVLLIASLAGLVGWLLYRYREHFPVWSRTAAPARATEVGGLDIRAESLPQEVTAAVRAQWAAGEQRAALALLYRATLSRLVEQNGLQLRQGNTEGDCLRLAGQARLDGHLGQGRLDIAAAATSLWLNGAYGARWPDTATVDARCTQWDAQFGPGPERAA